MNAFLGAILTGALSVSLLADGPPSPSQGVQEEPAAGEKSTRLRTDDIERWPWPADPWPELDRVARRSAESDVRQRMQGELAEMGARSGEEVLVRTRYFLLGGDLTRSELTRVGTTLDAQVRRMESRFGYPLEHEPFAGRVGIVLMGSRDRYMLLEAERFGWFTPATIVARLHVDGPRSIISAEGTAPRGQLDHQLARRVVHAWMHALGSPRRLPAWANEGMATALAWTEVQPGAGPGRLEAIGSVRSGEGLADLVLQDETWSGRETDAARAGLLMERLVLDKPAKLHEWILAVKGGADWRGAFIEVFNASPEELATYADRWYLVND